MSVIADILGFMSGSGLTTVIATAGGAYVKYKERKLEMAHQLALVPHEKWKMLATYKLHKLQLKSDHITAERDLEGELADIDASLLGEAIHADSESTVTALQMDNMPWFVGAIKTLFRPGLTILLWVAVVLIMIVNPVVTGYMDIVVGAITNGAEASLGLWFGSRMMDSRESSVARQKWTL